MPHAHHTQNEEQKQEQDYPNHTQCLPPIGVIVVTVTKDRVTMSSPSHTVTLTPTETRNRLTTSTNSSSRAATNTEDIRRLLLTALLSLSTKWTSLSVPASSLTLTVKPSLDMPSSVTSVGYRTSDRSQCNNIWPLRLKLFSIGALRLKCKRRLRPRLRG